MATTYSSGVVTAYGAALEGGFTGTYGDFCQLMATLPTEYGNIEGSIAQPYSSSNTYPNIGTYVWHNGILYKNIVPITTAEEWTAAHWTTAEIGGDLINLENIVSATTGNLLPDYNANSWTSPSSVSITRDGYALIINGTKENAGAVTITDQFVLSAGSYEFGVCDEDSLAGTGAYIQLFADGDVMSQTQTHTSVIVAAEKNVSFRILLNAGAEFNNLAIKPMLFAGSIPNTYIPQVSACDYEVRNNVDQITTELNEKANIDGSYSSLTAGNAEQLVSTVGVNDKTPYLFRTTGGSADVGDRVKVSEITGGTVAWNQLVQNGNFNGNTENWTASGSATRTVSKNVLTITSSAINSIQQTLPLANANGHRILFCGTLSTTASANFGIYKNSSGTYATAISPADGTKVRTERIVTISAVPTDTFDIRIRANTTNSTTITVENVNVFDITLLFGSTIADYIYGLEQANAGAGVAWFRKLFPKDYYAYDAGSLLSVKTTAHKEYGFNAYNPDTGKAKVVGGQAYQITGTYTALSLDGTSITPDASGYFTPAASGELTVTGGNSTDTCIHLKWDGERDGEYEPYEEHTYALDDVELRGIPKLDANNNLYYDGDGYAPDGTVTRRFGIVDLGTLTYTKNSGAWRATIPDRKYAGSGGGYIDSIIVGYAYDYNLGSDMTYAFSTSNNGYVWFRNDTYTTADAFKTAMSGVYLVYELATPTTESADPYQETQVCNDFGTEEFVDSRTVPMPVGANALYQANLRAKLEMAPDSPDGGNGDYIVRQTDGTNEYVALSDNSIVSGLVTRCPVCPTDTDGTFKLTATVSGGSVTYSWVSA